MNVDRQGTKSIIGSWKGLLHSEPKHVRAQVFLALLILSASMTFTQLGFIGIDVHEHSLGYVLGLLAPVTVASLLLGKVAGTLFGLLAGGILYLHARLQPLDLFERLFITARNSVILYAACGFVCGLLFAVALRNHPQGQRKVAYLGLVCLCGSLVAGALFYVNAQEVLASAVSAASAAGAQVLSVEWRGATEAVWSVVYAIPLDVALMLGVCLLADRAMQIWTQPTGVMSVRTAFRIRLFVVVVLVFAVVQAASFVAITMRARQSTWTHMKGELEYLDDQLDRSIKMTRGLIRADVSGEISEDVYDELIDVANAEGILNGYDLTDGTIVVFYEDEVSFSYNSAFPNGARVEELFDVPRLGTLEELTHADGPVEIVYRTNPDDNDSFVDSELGYMCVIRFDDFYLMMAMPFSLVFAGRQVTMIWATILALMLAATVYVLAARLLSRNVMAPIDRTNASLAQITAGNLDVTVSEHENVEFSSLSAGINTTVSALKMLIAEAERRNEQDLATARAIQESALPRTFPPFPDVQAFDIFASMHAAKEVGGDFFDYFLINDHTLGLLIADVSGKGVPGALFMMAAKTELENCLTSGMTPAEAIAAANKALCANNDAGMFVTVWAATLDWETGLVTYVNAGHNFPLLRHGHGGTWEWLKKKCGLFLGTFETAKYRQETLVLQPGDELLLYTDGVNEAFDLHEQEYGNDRLEEFLAAHADLHPRRLARALRGSVSEWARDAEQSDDVTILVLEYGVAPEKTESLAIPATLDRLPQVTGLVLDELIRMQCPTSIQHEIAIAIEELFVNVCNYAYADENESGDVCVRYSSSHNPSSITVELLDQGKPFDPLRRADPPRPKSIQEARIGGLGIYMVKRTMNEFTYTRNGNTNIVTFSKTW